MKLFKLAVFTMAMGFFVISCGNKNTGNTNTSDSTMNTVTDTMASPAVPDTTQHPADGTNTNTMDTSTQPMH
ncbi:MAG: hypothetical protein JSS96_07590 [Bacteroidetes bacterium]|nr:hypothetical protein [Bacteroidota bacterium]